MVWCKQSYIYFERKSFLFSFHTQSQQKNDHAIEIVTEKAVVGLGRANA